VRYDVTRLVALYAVCMVLAHASCPYLHHDLTRLQLWLCTTSGTSEVTVRHELRV